MKWSDVTEFLGNSAPVVGTLLGGPAGGIVGGLISKALGTEENPDAVIEAVKNNPDALMKIKELESSQALAELQAKMDTFRIVADSEKANIQTIVNAQDVYKAKNEQADKIANSIFTWNLPIIVLLVGVNLAAIKYISDAAMLAVVTNITGMAIKTAWDERSTVLNFFFGSSMGSRKAQESMLGKV